ncbi:MAG: Bax inhibitor-1/YccA family protein [Phyllobacteriaceae bacterium]|jgi:FtsH-binding integral membrane protein|nr:Bax inhibitor-1/YccA family protein [Phyllobacteriaceae bacterium]
MAELRNVQYQAGAGARTYDASIDQGLRSYMIRVYNLMALAMGITALFAAGTVMLATTNNPAAAAAALPNGTMLTALGTVIYGSPLRWVIMLAPLALVFFLSFRIDRMQTTTAQITFWSFAALIGMSLSSIFLVYTSASIVQTFFITATAFGALSLYGYTTKRDLTGMGSFLLMGLVGLILAMIVNIFLGSGALQFAISVIGVLIFAGLTAYDTQKIKEMYYVGDGAAVAEKKAIMGALALYLDFINMFQFLLMFLGNRE